MDERGVLFRPRPHVSGSFWKRILFYPFWVPVHTETAFSVRFSVTENEAFRKRSPEWIFLKTPFSCSRVDGWKRSFSKRWRQGIDLRRIRACARFFGDHARAFFLSVFFHRSLTAEYRYRLWNFVIEYRIVSVTAFPCGRGYFWKRSSCGRESFWKRIKKDVFSKISGYVWTGP